MEPKEVSNHDIAVIAGRQERLHAFRLTHGRQNLDAVKLRRSQELWKLHKAIRQAMSQTTEIQQENS